MWIAGIGAGRLLSSSIKPVAVTAYSSMGSLHTCYSNSTDSKGILPRLGQHDICQLPGLIQPPLAKVVESLLGQDFVEQPPPVGLVRSRSRR